MSQRLFLMSGIPGSGKSTWIAKQAEVLEPEDFQIISRDAIRFSLLQPGEEYFKRENAVFAQFVKNINDSIADGVPYIFIDATHISYASRAKVLSRLRIPEHCALAVEVFCPSVETCQERNSKRTGDAKVPAAVITNMAAQFEFPVVAEFAKYNFEDVRIYKHDEEVW